MNGPSGASFGRNRRRHPRSAYEGPVILVNAGEVETVSARDLAAGGIYLNAASAPPVGARVQVEFAVGKDRRFSLWGTVVRQDVVDPDGVRGFAVRFDAQAELETALAHAI